MISLKNAIRIIKREYPEYRISSCLDYDNFYLFIVAPLLFTEPIVNGHVFDAVDKKTGKLFQYDILDNPDAFLNAKEIEVNDVLNRKV